jgi:arabinose-5-phosphate isomerase
MYSKIFKGTPLLGNLLVGALTGLVGIITDADLRRHLTKAQTDGFSTKISEVMTANPKHICSTALAAEATAIFHKYRIDELPVVDAGNKPIGMIDVQDIVTIKIVN